MLKNIKMINNLLISHTGRGQKHVMLLAGKVFSLKLSTFFIYLKYSRIIKVLPYTGRGKRHVMSFLGNLLKINRSVKNCYDEGYKIEDT